MDKIKCINNFGKYVELPKDKFVMRPSAYGVIHNKGKVVLMTCKTNGKYWFPGGGIKIGEKLKDGLRREVKEETGLDVKIEKFLFFKDSFFYYEPVDGAYQTYLFFYLCTTKEKRLIPDNEVNDLESCKPRWVKIRDIKEEDFPDMNKKLYSILRKLQ